MGDFLFDYSFKDKGKLSKFLHLTRRYFILLAAMIWRGKIWRTAIYAAVSFDWPPNIQQQV
jgi:hypothetical protein